jgi:putative ABC transport system substrate-binding protein
MRRRELISLLGGAATWPLAARAQQPTMPVIGFLGPSSPDTFADRLRGLRQGLKETGYVEGENVTIVYRFAENRNDRLPELAADLIRQQVAVITTAGDDVAIAAKAATTTVPLFSSSAKTRSGLVLSLASPSRAATRQESIFWGVSWWQSGWESCVSWCRQRLALPCSSIQPMLRI